jgi:hypothetical protein
LGLTKIKEADTDSYGEDTDEDLKGSNMVGFLTSPRDSKLTEKRRKRSKR